MGPASLLSSMGFSRQEYWSGLPYPSPGNISYPGIEPWLMLEPFNPPHPSFPKLRIPQDFPELFTRKDLHFIHSVVSNSLWPHGLQHARLPCPSPTPGAYSNSCPLSWWCHPTITSSAVPCSSCLQSSPASGSFQMHQFLLQIDPIIFFTHIIWGTAKTPRMESHSLLCHSNHFKNIL